MKTKLLTVTQAAKRLRLSPENIRSKLRELHSAGDKRIQVFGKSWAFEASVLSDLERRPAGRKVQP